MIKFYMVILLILTSCNSKKKDSNIINKSEKYNSNKVIKTQENLTFKDLKNLTKNEAILKYGKPTSSEQFILDDAQGEFRNRISDKFSAKERQSESILIDELTWEKDKKNWITVWYQVTKNKSIPKEIFIWRKGTEF